MKATSSNTGDSGNGNGSATASVFSVEKRADGVAVIRMDVPGETMNTLQDGFVDDAARVFDELDRASDV